MDTLTINGSKYWLPENEQDVISLVNDAKQNNEIICLRGAAHSFPLIDTLQKGSASGKTYKYVMLSKMFAYKYLGNNLVWVQAGCHLGPDPFDPTGISTLDNSLLFQLNNPPTPEQPSLSIPDLGGITHQTVGGFLSTSSSGGSTQYSFEDALMSIDIICYGANGAEKVTFKRPVPDNPDDPFYGAGVATMGLFGIIVSATFKCSPQFYIAGQEAITTVDDCAIDLFGDGEAGKPSLATFLKQTEYTRLMWWPQKKITKMVVWQAGQTDQKGARDWAAQAYKKLGVKPPFPPLKPYQEVPYLLKSPIPATAAAGLFYTAIGTWPDWLHNLLEDHPFEYEALKFAVEASFYPLILPFIMNNVFVKPDAPETGPQQFSDVWYTGLPMDNQISDELMPVWFTELWIPIEDSQNVMNDLLEHYTEGSDDTGAFSCEIYAAKSSPFWFSPSYQQDVVRIDIFWFAKNKGNPTAFYQGFWDLLSKYKYRPHWGKYIPDRVKTSEGSNVPCADYLKECYQKWNAWMALREKMDPDQIFLNDYWRSHLGIS
ncbi:MAG TPA: D-arabinono-1,4-lactone oxidase [Mucilaginibacter sp.]